MIVKAFVAASGLKINLSQSATMGINITMDEAKDSAPYGVALLSFPITYLPFVQQLKKWSVTFFEKTLMKKGTCINYKTCVYILFNDSPIKDETILFV